MPIFQASGRKYSVIFSLVHFLTLSGNVKFEYRSASKTRMCGHRA